MKPARCWLVCFALCQEEPSRLGVTAREGRENVAPSPLWKWCAGTVISNVLDRGS